ncbi:Hypothetical protein D9617_37g012310 [Elsinoe fawcettii]|nr:Hypothetical protein D9617_37g012310 [Elsinoe fawcettii]
MPEPATKVAFVAGANGISGNAIVEHLIRTPKTEWSRIIISSRSPLKCYWQDPRVEFVAIDFLKPVDEIVAKLESANCTQVTHAFFTSYVHVDDFARLRELNVPLFENFLNAIDNVANSSLRRVVLQTGGKHYGIHLGPTEAPIHEGMGRYKDHGENFYYPQEDALFALSEKRSWDWNVIRPNAIIGFTPGINGMSQALTLALYILINKERGETPRFPGNEYFYNCVDDSSYAPSIADMSVWAATTEHCRNEAFNHTNGDTFVWRYFWPRLGKYFGVDLPSSQEFSAKGKESVMANEFTMESWAAGKKDTWLKICKDQGGNENAFDWGTWFFFDWSLGKAWPTLGTASKARKYGWTRYDDTFDTWIETFKSFEAAGVLPKQNHALKRKDSARTNGHH